MQTFLPYASFSTSAKVLDYRRLGKQRVECKQIYLALTDPEYGWQNHPATRMWAGYEGALLTYMAAICAEWQSRGYKDTLLEFALQHLEETSLESIAYPPWFGDKAFHASHRSNLLRKDPEFYSRYDWAEPPNLPYIWPQEKAA